MECCTFENSQYDDNIIKSIFEDSKKSSLCLDNENDRVEIKVTSDFCIEHISFHTTAHDIEISLGKFDEYYKSLPCTDESENSTRDYNFVQFILPQMTNILKIKFKDQNAKEIKIDKAKIKFSNSKKPMSTSQIDWTQVHTRIVSSDLETNKTNSSNELLQSLIKQQDSQKSSASLSASNMSQMLMSMMLTKGKANTGTPARTSSGERKMETIYNNKKTTCPSTYMEETVDYDRGLVNSEQKGRECNKESMDCKNVMLNSSHVGTNRNGEVDRKLDEIDSRREVDTPEISSISAPCSACPVCRRKNSNEKMKSQQERHPGKEGGGDSGSTEKVARQEGDVCNLKCLNHKEFKRHIEAAIDDKIFACEKRLVHEIEIKLQSMESRILAALESKNKS